MFYAVMEVLGEHSIILGLSYGAYLVSLNQGFSIGSLTAFAFYIGFTGAGIIMLFTSYTETKKSLGVY